MVNVVNIVVQKYNEPDHTFLPSTSKSPPSDNFYRADATGLKEVDQVRESQEKVVHALQVELCFSNKILWGRNSQYKDQPSDLLWVNALARIIA